MVQFNINWDSNTTKQHLVPNTYLKAWSNDQDHVYYIDKNEKIIDFTSTDIIKRTKKLTVIQEFYSRNILSHFTEQNDLIKIFAPLNTYTVYIKGKEIRDLNSLKNSFIDFNKWIIKDSLCNTVSSELKEELKNKIKSIQVRDIEEAWNRMFENTWPITRMEIINTVNSSNGKQLIDSIKRKELIKFMVAIHWRTYPPNEIFANLFYEVINMFGEEFTTVLKEELDEEDKHLSVVNTFGEHLLHDLSLKYFLSYFRNSGPIYKEFESIYEGMVIELLVAEKGYEFLTSDKPVNLYKNSDNKVEYIFPICPSIACAVRKNKIHQDKTKYIVTNYSKEQVFKFNNSVRSLCYKGYILKEPDTKIYFGK
ncbi:DUF4238 domain-containing protein [Bacillus mycoides]|uniref:DUF4238 domain-containing protein n=1 Tax=Bacillus mycoides TaxID=1405 RepID=UPI00339C48B5